MPLFTPAQLIFISIAHFLKFQTLDRTPEPSSPSSSSDRSSVLTDDQRAVSDYTHAMETKMALLYAAVLEIIHRTRSPGNEGRALDVACGPGHLAIDLARHMGYDQVTGVDLSEPMIRAAEINAKQRGVADRVRFQIDDATRLSSLPDNHFDLSAITFAAHHFDKIDSVRRILMSLDRVTRPEGIVFLFDVIRLKTRRNTEHYIRVLGHDYFRRGLLHFLDDFRNSMYAAFTCGELKTAVPNDSRRSWIHWTPRFVPSMQILIGLPVGRKKVFLRPFLKKSPLLEEWAPHWKKTVGPRWVRQTLLEGALNKITLATGKMEHL
jgi:ubiquinone/menaquinone biosynthesis C-methylase UbiE